MTKEFPYYIPHRIQTLTGVCLESSTKDELDFLYERMFCWANEIGKRDGREARHFRIKQSDACFDPLSIGNVYFDCEVECTKEEYETFLEQQKTRHVHMQDKVR